MDKKNSDGVRINKYISDYGFCSRREADKLIDDERVTINNRPATQGDRVCEGDKVRIDGEQLVFIPREARPKSHRWGPPRNTEATEQPTHRAGQRGAVRNSNKPRPATTKSATKPAATKGGNATKGSNTRKPSTQSNKRK